MGFLKRLLCRHDYEPTGQTCTGVTADWGGGVTPQYTFHEECSKCGRGRNSAEKILPREVEKIYGRKWDANGWPLNPDGTRIPMKL